MTMQELIAQALNALVEGRVYPDYAEEGTPPPYIVYQDVGGADRVEFLDRSDPGKENARVQVTVWSASRLDANRIARLASQALAAVPALQARPVGGPHDSVDPATGLRGRIQDYSFWTDTPS